MNHCSLPLPLSLLLSLPLPPSPSLSLPLSPSLSLSLQARLAGTSYITYSVDSEGHTLSREEGCPLNQAVPLYKTFKHILQDMHIAYRSDQFRKPVL